MHLAVAALCSGVFGARSVFITEGAPAGTLRPLALQGNVCLEPGVACDGCLACSPGPHLVSPGWGLSERLPPTVPMKIK